MIMKLVVLKTFYFLCTSILVESARILAVFPVPSISHQIVFRPLMQELARRGHEVVVITTDPAFAKGQSPQNLTEIDVHDVAYNIWNEFLETGQAQTGITRAIINKFLKLIAIIFEAEVKSANVQKLINDRNQNFDLLFIESCVRPALSFAYLYDVPTIAFSSMGGIYGTFDGTGATTNSLVYPLPMRRRIYNLTLWEKISELYLEFIVDRVFEDNENFENKMIRRIFGVKVPNLSELKKQVEMVFLNVNPIWDFNRPVPPNIIYLGGMHQKAAQELPKDIKNYLDSSKNGVIYMSFGTNARPSLLPPEKLRVSTNVFSELPYDILWKWDKDDLPERPKNVKISKWLPQSDLLKHPKVKLFITQGGLQSTDEALTAGVPLIAMPFLGDQWFNAEQYVKHNIGIHLNLENLTENKLKNAIETIMKNKTYRENVVKLGNLIRDQPQKPLERAVWWTEHVLRHGGAAHLRSAGAHLHWTEYYALDVLLLILVIFLIIFIGIALAVRFALIKYRSVKMKVKGM